MLIGTLTPTPYQTVLDATGNPVSGAKIYTYAAGTTTPIATFTDVDLLVPNANPIVADSAGRYVAFLSPNTAYKFDIFDAALVPIRTQDNILATGTGTVDTPGIAGQALTAGDVVYMSDGTSGETAGRWYQADADMTFRSTLPALMGIALVSLATGGVGSIRISGRVPGLSGLVAGTPYYVSATAGQLTAVAPANARVMGVADSTTSLILAVQQTYVASASLAGTPAVCQGRLTLTTGVPVTTADVTAATSIYFTPYAGNKVGLYSGTAWALYTFTERTLALGTITNDLPYDVFLYDNAGTLTLELLAWTSKTARATALVLQDGIWVKTGALTRRYLGTFHTTSTTTTEDSLAKRLLWNYYNRVQRPMRVPEATDSWTYSTLTWRQARASTANQLAIVIGVAEAVVDVEVIVFISSDTIGGQGRAAIGEDSTTVPAAEALFAFLNMAVATYKVVAASRLIKAPTVGYHYYAWLEMGTGGVITWYGDNTTPNDARSGIHGCVMG